MRLKCHALIFRDYLRDETYVRYIRHDLDWVREVGYIRYEAEKAGKRIWINPYQQKRTMS